MQEEQAPTQKYGYVDVKQPAKVKGRKLKSWRRRWAVLTLLNDLSRGGKPLAKLDLFETESKWNRDSSDRVTFVLENVSTIRDAQSRTHPHALEIVQRQAVLALSGVTEVDSYGWTLALQQMLVPSQVVKYEDSFQVCVMPNEDATRCGLCGDHVMSVTPQHIELVKPSGLTSITWGLSTLLKFNQEGHSVIVIQCGPNSPTGGSTFRLSCTKAEEALKSIRQCICQALLRKQNTRLQKQKMEPVQSPCNSATAERTPRDRKVSASMSEKGIQGLLEKTALSLRLERSDSDSSEASMPSPPLSIGSHSLQPMSLASQTSGGACNGKVEHAIDSRGFSNDQELVGQNLYRNTNDPIQGNNNSHCSLGDISPVFFRQNYSPIDISKMGLTLNQKARPEEIKSKRSSDSNCVSITELEAVPERDEFSERDKPDPFRLSQASPLVNHDLGSMSPSACVASTPTNVRKFDECISQCTGYHRRYSSLPAADTGYSVIKDFSSSVGNRERAATIGDSGCFNTEELIKDEEHKKHDAWVCSNNCVQVNQETKVESQYSEIDHKKENPYSAIGGRSGRRRSSSLSDLQTVKYTSKMPNFENVYEDVDELRETMKKLRQMSITDDPPALPARPFSVSFSASSTQASPGSKPRAGTVGGSEMKSSKKKRFLFGKNKQSTSLDLDNVVPVLNNKPHVISPQSDIPISATDPFSPYTTCGASKTFVSSSFPQSTTFKSNMSCNFSSSTEELIHASDSSSISELYADIGELRANQGKRRRSSDITPVKHLLDLNMITKVSENSPAREKRKADRSSNKGPFSLGQGSVCDQKPPALPQRRISPPSKKLPTSGDNLIHLEDDIHNKNDDQSTVASTSRNSSPKVFPHQPPPASDPLISFFLDDDMFQENPMVTGTMHSSKPINSTETFPPNTKQLSLTTHSFHSNKLNPFSSSYTMNDLLDSNNNSNSNSSSPVSQWSKNFNETRSTISPLHFSNPFTEDLILWTSEETSGKRRIQSPVKASMDGNYLTMTEASQCRDQGNVYMTPSGK